MPRRMMWMWLLLAWSITACGRSATSEAAVAPYPTLDPEQVARGRQVYAQQCASCHGANAEGAANWATPGPDGLHPAPGHDDSGHTWHHSDRVLYETIRDGMGDTLSDADIRAVIEYFKSLWTDEHRQYQWEETRKDFAPTPTPH